MTRDPIVEEVRAARDKIAADHDYDLAAIFAALRAMGAESDVERVTLSAKPVHQVTVDAAAQRSSVFAASERK